MGKTKDFRIGQKIIATLKIEDKGQDFTELDILENGVLLGDSAMFGNGRVSLLGIGTLTGTKYFSDKEVLNKPNKSYKGLYIYLYRTGEEKPLPWKATTLNYKIIGSEKVKEPNRFVKR